MEAVAGRMENEEPLDAACREAMEEAGVRIRGPEHIATCWSSPGVSTERWYLYLATYSPADRVGPGGGRADRSAQSRQYPWAGRAGRFDCAELELSTAYSESGLSLC